MPEPPFWLPADAISFPPTLGSDLAKPLLFQVLVARERYYLALEPHFSLSKWSTRIQFGKT
jgi:hypothetical protein